MPGILKKNNYLKKSRYRPEIDGLRAFAVITVIVNHFNKNILPGGYLGVDIFFVISGYVITSSLLEMPSMDFKDFISRFYERRIKRLVPALSIFVLIMSIVISLFNPFPVLSLRTGLSSLFGVSNLYLLRQSTDYFAQSTELNVFTHTWSLGVEEQFYVVFPFLIWFSGFGRKTSNGEKNLFFILGSLAFASLISFFYLYHVNQPVAYFSMLSRFWEMAAGCLLLIGLPNIKSLEQFLEMVPPLLVLALLIGVMYLPMSMAAISTIAVVLLSSFLIASLKKHTAAFKIFTNPKVVYIGLISYSLYLWHWGILSISRWTIGIHWWSVPLQISLIIVFAIASHRWIETPFRRGNWLGKEWETLIFGAVLLISQFLGLNIFSKQQKIYLGKNGDTQLNNDFSPYLPMKRRDCVSPSPKDICFSQPIKENQKTFYFAGDSHTAHLIPMAGILRKKHGSGIIFSTNQNFPSLIQTSRDNAILSLRKLKIKKKKMDDLFIKNISSLKKGDLIVFSSYFDMHLKEYSYNLDTPDKKFFYGSDGEQIAYTEVFDKFKNNFNKWAQYSLKRGLNIVVFSQIPIFKGVPNTPDTWACTKEWFRPILHKGCALNFSEPKVQIENRINDTNKILRSIAIENENVYFFDAFNILCPAKNCSSFISNAQIFRDDNHLTQEGSEYLAPYFVNFLKTNGLFSE